VVLPLAASALGCGGGQAAQVSGRVTLNDQPLATGTVTFHPADGEGAVAVGLIDVQGRFQISTGTDAGLAPGAYIVTVVATEAFQPADPNAEVQYRDLAPARYANVAESDLKVDVKAGSNDVPLVLRSP
jgi:hypothetical protein